MIRAAITILLSLLSWITPAFAQSNQTDWNTFTITTYYPSPHGVYNRMEVKRALSVGNFTDAPSGLGSVLELDGGQLFVGESMILKSQPSAPSDGLAGQLIYVNNTATNERMLKFHNGTAWVNATGCPSGKQCYTTNSNESCSGGLVCKPSTCIALDSCPCGNITVYYYEPWGTSYYGHVTYGTGGYGTAMQVNLPGSWSTSPPCTSTNMGTACAATTYKTGCLKITSDNTPPAPASLE